jgi:hypothetical protein
LSCLPTNYSLTLLLSISDRKTKHAKLAKKQLDDVCALLGEKDKSLVTLAKHHVPEEIEETKKRKADSNGDLPRIKKKANANTRKKTGDLTLGEREDHGMEALCEFIEQKGGSGESVQNFRCRVKKMDGRYETSYFNEQGKKFRSMVEVAKYFNLVADTTRSAAGKKAATIKKRKPTTTREIENEKKKMRKELDKLRRQHTKATKVLDDFLTEEKESRYPIDDTLLLEEEESTGSKSETILPTNCAAARLPNVESFPGLPQHFMPDVLMTWDFLSTFTRAISVNPISFDDFLQCLTYEPPTQLADSDALNSPPVYLGEAHLGLLKLVLGDLSSEDWWWSILETEETENAVADMGDIVGKEESYLPLIKVDFAALLMETEDPLITTSWLQNLEQVKMMKSSDDETMKRSIKTAMSVAANKWVLAYLRKALKLGKTSGAGFMKRAVVWLVDRVKDARPDLGSKSVSQDTLQQSRAKIVEEVSQQMEKLSSAALTVNDDDVASDVEYSDDESDDSDDEEEGEKGENADGQKPHEVNSDERPASYIPTKPPPSLVDLLLPPGKPAPPNDLLSSSCWPEMAGATATRIIHRYKRLRNEVDDSLRLAKELPRLTVRERRQREALAQGRVFSEFAMKYEETNPAQRAADHLCAGGNYLDLAPLERLCILRVLIDAAYDTRRLHEVVDNNIKQRKNAAKALDTEQKKAKKEAKEKAAADEAAARHDLALEAQRAFLEEKRDEIRKANEASQALTSEEIDTLTEEDILDFDDDIRADYEALPGPESFKKAEVLARVSKIQEAAAFETELLTVVSTEELHEREKAALEAMEAELEELGGDDALLEPDLDRRTVRTIEKLRRELGKIKSSEDILPLQREAALENLKEAISDGTIKSLRSAIRVAKTARLFGPDEATNGVWALDIVRDAHMELENAKQIKRVADARKELISKLNKCFIRTEPLGMDRFGNRFWHFENTDNCQIWAEVDYVLKESNPNVFNMPGFLQLVSDVDHVKIGPDDIEQDFARAEGEPMDKFLSFGRQEYHQSGAATALAKRCWGGHVNESSVKTLMKGLDSRGIREEQLKTNLKEAVDDKTSAIEGAGEKEVSQQSQAEEGQGGVEDEEANSAEKYESSGDETVFEETKNGVRDAQSDFIQFHLVENLTSGIGQKIRKRTIVEATKDGEVARYEVGSVTGWNLKKETVPIQPDGDEFEPQTKTIDVPVWQAHTEHGHEILLTGSELLESICRHSRWKTGDATYFEHDAAFLAYRNSLGRHCGNKADAAHSMTPIRFAQFMVRREADLYQRLKHCVFDNSWGGKAGSRNAWVSSMKDYAFDFESVKEGLLTLEYALFEMTGGLTETPNGDEGPSGRELLDNPATRDDIELESIEKTITCIWASKASRNIFLEIMKCESTKAFKMLVSIAVSCVGF